MRKNIRRSLMVAAAASGIWALSTAGASAAELPVSTGTGTTGTVDAVDDAVEEVERAAHNADGTAVGTVGSAKETVTRTPGTVEDVVSGVAGKLPTKGIPENGLPTNTLPTNGLPTGSLPSGSLPSGAAHDVTGPLHGTDAPGAVEGARTAVQHASHHAGQANKAVKEARKDLRSATAGLPAEAALPDLSAVPGEVTRHLPPHTLPAVSVPGAPVVPGLPEPGVPAVPSATGVPSVPGVGSVPATGEIADGLAAAGLRTGRLTAALDGGNAQDTVGEVRRAVSTAHPILDGASGAVLPPVARGRALHVRPAAYQAATDVAVTADHASAATAPFAEAAYVRSQALADEATGGEAGDVTRGVGDFGRGVASDAVPYAHTTGTGLHADAQETASHAVTNVTATVAAPPRQDLTDAANFPGMPATSQFSVVPGVTSVPATSSVPGL
ncbi:hypothetical protein [Streptomyces marispadix]|uniref:Secreted protein n=1 Tax=Streptomyces marispadix TaxID=2922868 RepID=A0ABS9T0T7_9ACTN|nr:hypothetical protein [Streptomyces marispadix]MCH6162152.1 hypothetical protein [Streptomyces marispadix]